MSVSEQDRPEPVRLGARASLPGGRPHLTRAVATLLLGVSTWAVAQTGGLSAASSPALSDVSPWLHRVQSAAVNSNYQGTLMISAGGVVTSSRVLHVCEGRQCYERTETLDGRARVQFRHNDSVLTVWPASKLARAEQRDLVAEFPALPSASPARTGDSYEAMAQPRDRVAGHEADVMLFKPRDKLRFAQRLWVDRETGLLLRSELLAPGGEVLETAAFTDVQIGGKPSPEPVMAAMKRLDGYRVLRAPTERTQIEQEGWTLARSVGGFQLVSCARRQLEAGPDAPGSVPALQTVFTDGLAHVSVFIEPHDAQRRRQAQATSLGATHTLTSREGDWWITVIGEVPMVTLQQFRAMFERKH